eukprot:gene8535-biopygen12143
MRGGGCPGCRWEELTPQMPTHHFWTDTDVWCTSGTRAGRGRVSALPKDQNQVTAQTEMDRAERGVFIPRWCVAGMLTTKSSKQVQHGQLMLSSRDPHPTGRASARSHACNPWYRMLVWYADVSMWCRYDAYVVPVYDAGMMRMWCWYDAYVVVFVVRYDAYVVPV